MVQVPTGCGCPEPCYKAHAATGWCLEATGDPVIIISIIDCSGDVVERTFVDPSTGTVLAEQAVVACQPEVIVTIDLPLTTCGADEALRVSVCNAVSAVVQNLPTVDCNGEDAVRVFICNTLDITFPETILTDCDGNDALRVSVCNPVSSSNCPPTLTPLGHEQISVADVALGLTVPVGATIAWIENRPQATQAVLWRDDGVSPTQDPGGIGHTLSPGITMEYAGDLSAIEFIRRTGGGTATLEVSYYSCV